MTDLLQAKDAPDQAGYDAAGLQQKIGELQLQKYILESATEWGQYRNETGKTIGVYAHKPTKKAAFTSDASTLYYLADGEETDDDWNCDGVLLPTGATVAGIGGEQALTEPLAVKLVSGTQLVAKADPTTGIVELNVPATKVLKAADSTWTIPTVSQTDIDAKLPTRRSKIKVALSQRYHQAPVWARHSAESSRLTDKRSPECHALNLKGTNERRGGT